MYRRPCVCERAYMCACDDLRVRRCPLVWLLMRRQVVRELRGGELQQPREDAQAGLRQPRGVPESRRSRQRAPPPTPYPDSNAGHRVPPGGAAPRVYERGLGLGHDGVEAHADALRAPRAAPSPLWCGVCGNVYLHAGTVRARCALSLSPWARALLPASLMRGPETRCRMPSPGENRRGWLECITVAAVPGGGSLQSQRPGALSSTQEGPARSSLF